MTASESAKIPISDGQADKFTVFADELSIPTAITFAHGGVIVQNGTETLWLQDTDGDDRADQREPLITGWNMRDTHGGVSNLRYGLDNWIYGMQGYNDSRPVATRGSASANSEWGSGGSGYRHRVRLLSWKRSNSSDPTNNNTWGLGMTEEGLLFGSTANRHPSVFLPIPNRYYERVRGWSVEQLSSIADTHLFHPITSRVRQVDHHGGYTAGAGHAVYNARAYPRSLVESYSICLRPHG